MNSLKTLAVMQPSLSVIELAILQYIARFDRVTITNVAVQFDIRPQEASRHLHAMALGDRQYSGLDLIAIRRCEEDKRVRYCELTSRGKEVISILKKMFIDESKPVTDRCNKTVDFISERPNKIKKMRSLFED